MVHNVQLNKFLGTALLEHCTEVNIYYARNNNTNNETESQYWQTFPENT